MSDEMTQEEAEAKGLEVGKYYFLTWDPFTGCVNPGETIAKVTSVWSDKSMTSCRCTILSKSGQIVRDNVYLRRINFDDPVSQEVIDAAKAKVEEHMVNWIRRF